MSKKEKLIKRLKTRPKDFKFDELSALLQSLGYSILGGGKSSGSRITFTSSSHAPIKFHKPHPGNIIPMYLIDQIIEILEERKQI